MTSEQVINLKEGDIVYIVPLSHRYEFINPFVRTRKWGRSYYYKPLGVYMTTVKKIKEKENIGDSISISGIFDTSPMEDIILRCRYDEIPEGHKITDYASYEFASEEFWANYKNMFGDNNNTSNVFFTQEEAQQYYEKNLKKFNKDVKTYIAHIKNEIELANQNIINAQNLLKKYESIS